MAAQLRRLSQALKPIGVSGPIWRVLSELDTAGVTNINELARGTAFERSYVSRLLDEMAEKGWIESVHEGDRRARLVQLSRAGRAKCQAALRVVGPLNEETLSVLSTADRAALQAYLSLIAERIAAER